MRSSWPRLRSIVPPLAVGALALAASWLVSAQSGEAGLEACDDGPPAAAVVERLNQLRRLSDAPCTAAGRLPAPQPLHWEQRLASSAHEHAVDMALRDSLSHTDARQRSFGTRLRSVGYFASGAGENLAAGQHSLDDTLAAWLASPSHCANLMQPDYRDVGLACVQRRGSRYERFWVAHLGAPVRR
jgi:uncharacterized protein YkwD